MEQPKKFIKEGNVYKMKPQHTYNAVAIGLCLGLAYLGFRIHSSIFMWVFIVCTAIFVLSALSKSLVVDMDNKAINVKMSLLKPAMVIPFESIQHFELYTLKTNFITTNVTLNVYFLKDGKEKSAGLAQGFTKRSMQNLLNDIEDIIGTNGH
ncbi:hypothetical protein [Chitinophaga qingshengii]|uniref:PH domain-containing protein n=1 Tax=Chitinophaga qingshengii TaxID=1569794 RepID=A0ABR7TSX1_9BACT|nr:hypothetical protein [Chitinophaga qingshengii]MBC9933135.1 hypothetical protein [Chitinophaga qingshengii]